MRSLPAGCPEAVLLEKSRLANRLELFNGLPHCTWISDVFKRHRASSWATAVSILLRPLALSSTLLNPTLSLKLRPTEFGLLIVKLHTALRQIPLHLELREVLASFSRCNFAARMGVIAT
jgi:hypothetical protein